MALNRLFYGDNLDVLRRNITDESVDLIYLDPPFNSNRNYSVLFKEKSGDEAQAQIEAFDDTWTWSQDVETLYLDLLNAPTTPNKVKDALEAMRRLLGDNDVLAYLVMMTARLIELRRVLKPTGSLYLHCDPTASHYLKVMLDAIFGNECFLSEIIWKRSSAHSGSRKWGPVHDSILVYSRSGSYTWNQQYTAESDDSIAKWYVHEDERGRYKRGDLTGAGMRTGASGKPWRGWDPSARSRHWAVPRAIVSQLAGTSAGNLSPQESLDLLFMEGRIIWPKKVGGQPMLRRYLHEAKGVAVGDVLTDIPPLSLSTSERLGYPTQKPMALLERIITASSNPGDVVLDPFCGCGTTVDAAQKLGRRWVGIDVTTLAVDLIDARLRHTYGEQIRETYEMLGIPQDIEGARHLFERSPFEFERWCVMALDGQPNEKQVGDKGIDGVIRIVTGGKGQSDRVLISVKGGGTNPGHVQALLGTVLGNKAAMGVFATMKPPTKAMREVANTSGAYKHPGDGREYPRIQIITVAEMLEGRRPKLPPTLLPYFQAQRREAPDSQLPLDPDPN